MYVRLSEILCSSVMLARFIAEYLFTLPLSRLKAGNVRYVIFNAISQEIQTRLSYFIFSIKFASRITYRGYM